MARRISPPSAALALCMLALLLQGGVSAAGHCVLIPASMRLVWYAMYTSYMWCQPAGGRRQRLLQEHEHELFPGRHPESPYLLTLMLNMMRSVQLPEFVGDSSTSQDWDALEYNPGDCILTYHTAWEEGLLDLEKQGLTRNDKVFMMDYRKKMKDRE